jgi:RND family efflux transporter MFP subunit
MGSRAHFELDAYPGQHFMGSVSFVSPIVDPASRTGRVRLTAPNPGLKLRPGMFVTLYFDVPVGRDVLAVPREAVIITGERNLVFVRMPDGMLAPRRVVLGPRSDERVQILSGLDAGETIVASANFLVDAESRLASSGDAMPGMAGMSAPPAPAPKQPAAPPPAPRRATDSMPPMPGMEPRP